MNEYEINTKSEIRRLEKERFNILKQVMIISVVAVLFMATIGILDATYSTKIIIEKQQKVNELQNKVEQQYELIDALQQGEQYGTKI